MKQINREILSIAVPSIITNITTPLLALMDVVIVGHMGSADYIAAIAVGGTIFNMLYWLFAFLRMGSSGLTAQAHGSGNRTEVDLVLVRGLLVVAVASISMIVCQGPIFRLATKLFEIDTNILLMVREYFTILVWGAPASLGTFVISGWFLGQKNAKTPMQVSLIINISNIVISLMLVFIFGIIIKGVALCT
ncbi:MAG: MATE family efflux transporter, partial [Duncaniella sp.]|nr:MATE family efflux transporter [Duncaniella sp.]